jgi:hypothetical protein
MSKNTIIHEILNDVKKKNQEYIFKNRFDFTDKSIIKWRENANFTKKILDGNKINYCLFKGYDIPHAIMDDVDILIEDELVLRELLSKLKEDKFIFKHIPFNDELKVSAIDKKTKIEIDFYPDAKWGELRYERKGAISKNTTYDLKHGIKFPVPIPEYEIYIVATHSYYHGRINLLEILNTIKILQEKKPSLERIIKTSKSFHMQNALLSLLSISDKVMNIYGTEGIEKTNISELKKISNSRFSNISEKFLSLDQLPWKFSLSDIVLSSLDKFGARNLDINAKKSDELAGFVKHNRISNFFYSKFSKKYN